MKPQNKQQHEVYALSQNLPDLEAILKPWAFENCIKHVGFRTAKGNITCLCCGHSWQEGLKPALIELIEPTEEQCPKCNRTLKVTTTRKKIFEQLVHFAHISTVGNYQLNRYFQMRVYAKAASGKAPAIFFQEIVQQFLQPDGKDQVVARQQGMGMYQGNNFYHELEIRQPNTLKFGNYSSTGKYDIYTEDFYPEMDVLPEYTKRGFNGDFCKVSPYMLFTKLMGDNICETLYKAGFAGFLEARAYDRSTAIGKYWNSVKICMRNNYNLTYKQVTTWLDYIALLDQYNKDLRNPAFVCPENLEEAHNFYVAKATKDTERRRAKERLEEQERRLKEEAKKKSAVRDYRKWKKRFFDLSFTDGEITIQPLKSVAEFKEEGNALNHCVYVRHYYIKEDALILSARIGEQRIETIEVNLNTMKIVQARGKNNLPSVWNQRVIDLVNNNMRKIAAAHRGGEAAKKKKKAVASIAA